MWEITNVQEGSNPWGVDAAGENEEKGKTGETG